VSDLFDLENVHKHYGRFHALKGVSFSVSGGTFGLLGPNGAGKSTLIKVLLGLLPFEGSARVLGLDPRREASQIRDRVGYMPERDNYISGMNAVEYCTYAAELSGLPRSEAMSRAHTILEFVGLQDKRYQKIDGYSTGMKQRVKLAQALVHDPELLLLDEPTNGLDPAGRDELLMLIKSLPERRGCAILLSSHVLPDVEYVCERAILMHQGELQYEGTIADLKSRDVADTLEVRLKDGQDRFKEALAARSCTVEEDGAHLYVRGITPDAIFELADGLGVQVRHLQPRKLSLEAAFIRVVEEAESARKKGEKKDKSDKKDKQEKKGSPAKDEVEAVK
jgi:ABC-2 type transport system ATP-binding protein